MSNTGTIAFKGLGGNILIYIFPAILIFVCQIIVYSVSKSYKNTRSISKILIVFPFITLFLISALRGINTGIDTKITYTEAAGRVTALSFQGLLNYIEHGPTRSGIFERGSAILYWVLDRLFHSPQANMFAMAAVFLIAMYIFIARFSQDIAISTLAMLCMGMYLSSLNIARQMMAVGMVLLFYTAMYDRQYLRAGLWAFIAFHFHQSSLPPVLLIGLSFLLPADKRLLFVLLLITMAAPLLLPYAALIAELFFPKMAAYFSADKAESIIHLVSLVWVAEGAIVLYIMSRDWDVLGRQQLAATGHEKCTEAELGRVRGHIFRVLWYTAIYISATICSERVLLMDRIAYYFHGFVLLLFPIFTERMRRSQRGTIYWILILLLDLFLIAWLIRAVNNDSQYIYSLFFQD